MQKADLVEEELDGNTGYERASTVTIASGDLDARLRRLLGVRHDSGPVTIVEHDNGYNPWGCDTWEYDESVEVSCHKKERTWIDMGALVRDLEGINLADPEPENPGWDFVHGVYVTERGSLSDADLELVGAFFPGSEVSRDDFMTKIRSGSQDSFVFNYELEGCGTGGVQFEVLLRAALAAKELGAWGHHVSTDPLRLSITMIGRTVDFTIDGDSLTNPRVLGRDVSWLTVAHDLGISGRGASARAQKVVNEAWSEAKL